MLRLASLVLLGCALGAGCRSAPETTPAAATTTVGSGGAGGAPLPDPRPLTIVNWNIRNFVNHLMDDPVRAPLEETDPGWEAHRRDAGIVLSGIDADVVVLQEVEHTGVLEELNAEELDGRYTAVQVIDANDPRGIDLGVLSKHPLDDVVSHKDDVFTKVGTQSPTYRYARDCLEIRLTFNGRPLAILGVHYRSKSDDDPDKRLAEAQHTRAIADAIVKDAPETGIVILGDFNDLPGSPPYEWTIGSEPDLYQNAADHVPERDRWTFDYNGQLELVDQQMANPRMSALLDTQSVEILHGLQVETASDHSPVVATYLVN